MKNNRFRGVGAVYRFTAKQHYKALATKIFLLLLLIIGFAVIPILKMISGSGDTNEPTKITKLYVRNHTDFVFDAEELQKNERYSGVEILATNAPNDELGKQLAECPTAAAVSIDLDELKGIVITAYHTEDNNILDVDLSATAKAVGDSMHHTLLDQLSVSDEQITTLETATFCQVKSLSDYAKENSEADLNTHSMLNYAYSYLVFLLCTIAMTYVFSVVIEEKSSKLVESLLLNVNPTGLLVGKVLAVTTFILIGISVLIGSFLVSLLIAKSQGSIAFLTDKLEAIGFMKVFENVHAADVVLTVICVFLAYGIIALLCALFASLCSKIDDVQQVNFCVVGVMIFGLIASIISPYMESDLVNNILSLFPLTAIFIAPANYICGKITFAVLMISLILQVITIYLLALAAGKVYRMMVFYRGSVPSLKRTIQMLKADKESKKGGSAE